MGKLISLVIPVFNEEEVIQESYDRMSRCIANTGYDYEIIYVNDGSRDGTMAQLRKIAGKDRHVRAFSFSRNFGHQIAVTCGMDHAKGDALIIIDADLQDPPELFTDLIALWEQGAEVVYGKRVHRDGETLMKKLTASIYYRVLNAMSAYPIPLDTGDFRLLDRKVADVFLKMREHDRYLRGMSAWMGFHAVPLAYERHERAAGSTKYTLRKMVRLATAGITGFSDKPLTMPLFFGAAIGAAALLMLLVLALCSISFTVQGWLWCFAVLLGIQGILLGFIGIQGAYLGRIFEETKKRPLYIVADTINVERNEDE